MLIVFNFNTKLQQLYLNFWMQWLTIVRTKLKVFLDSILFTKHDDNDKKKYATSYLKKLQFNKSKTCFF